METFFGPKIPIDQHVRELMLFMDIDLAEALAAVVQDLKVFEQDNYSQMIEQAIDWSFATWEGAKYERETAYEGMALLKQQLQRWLFKIIDFDILCYFYCRTVKAIENSSEPQFTTFYLEMDALYDDVYRRNSNHIRESLYRHRIGFDDR